MLQEAMEGKALISPLWTLNRKLTRRIYNAFIYKLFTGRKGRSDS